jgi:hypothetical protein
VGLERGPLSLVNNLRSYLNENVAAPGLDRSVGIVCLRTKTTEFFFMTLRLRFQVREICFSSPERPDRLWAHKGAYPMGTAAPFSRLKCPGRETEISHPSSARARMRAVASLPNAASWAGVNSLSIWKNLPFPYIIF